MEMVASSVSSPDSKIFAKCLLIAGVWTPNKLAMAFCGNQKVSLRQVTLMVTLPSELL